MEALENFLCKEFYWLHRHPEVSFEEVETTAHLYNLLVENGVRVLDLPLKTGIVAEVGAGGPVMALRADIDALRVATIMVDEGPSMKRIRPRAKGRADRILKRTAHITVVVSDAKAGR